MAAEKSSAAHTESGSAQELSKFLAHWSEKGEKPIQDCGGLSKSTRGLVKVLKFESE